MTSVIEALESRDWEALSGPDGAAMYDDVIADDGLMVFPGLVLDKAASIQAIAGAPPWSSFELADVREVTATPDSALVTIAPRRSGLAGSRTRRT